ncbi:MAG: 50S ribosomal protein L30 [Candidatus Bathyarchaeota archaeon]|nr:MAG: 50S ribosomal protein L30 [Candidatus Bathyarchaeota archaeon]
MRDTRKCLAVIRVRGVSDIFQEIDDTLKLLHLTRNCHATLIDDRPSHLGMLSKAKDYLTWGEVSREGIILLLKKRGRLEGNRKLTDAYLQEIGYDTIEDLAEAVHKMKAEYHKLHGVKPIFRLRPPKKGYGGKVKRSFASGGVTGDRGQAINDLIKRMA